MPRCELTGKGPVSKHSVSHSNIKTKSRAFPNIRQKKFFSLQLGRALKFRVATSVIRDIDKLGSFDTFLLRQPSKTLSKNALNVKKKILKKILKSKPKPQGGKS